MHLELAEPSSRGLILPDAQDSLFGLIYSIMDRPFGGLWLWLVVINIIAFFIIGLDKWKAVRAAKKPDVHRFQDPTLLLIAAVGGSIGTLAGMKLFRHKGDQRRFTLGVPLILLAQILIPFLIYLYVTGFFNPAPVLSPPQAAL